MLGLINTVTSFDFVCAVLLTGGLTTNRELIRRRVKRRARQTSFMLLPFGGQASSY